MSNDKDIYSLIKARRSIRVYDPARAIPEDMLQRILDAGLWAASGKNMQNWQFYVLQGKKRDAYLSLSQKSWTFIKDILEKRLKPSLYAFTERFFYTLGNAPVIILAFAEINDQDHPQTQVGNVYLAVENIVLAAQFEGLGSCMMGSPLEIEGDVKRFLSIEDRSDLKLVCGITLGYAAHTPPTPGRRPERVIRFIE